MMRYHYYYQTKDNRTLDDWIVARDRPDAYAQLRKRGIKPYRLDGRNPLAWKRWTAIGVLAAVVVVLAAALALESGGGAPVAAERSQLYGDPATLQNLSANGWRDVFRNEGDAFLARHAIPGAPCLCTAASSAIEISATPLRLSPEDPPELAKMKRMVNCMKQELAEYLAAGGALADYMALCCQRQRTERDIILDTNRDFDKLRRKLANPEDADDAAQEWKRKNDLLRSMGLPTVIMPLEISGER
ncbi:MAG: hypothetical protein ACI4RD_01285 [Kiritimatiellia bacterium]